MSTDWHARGGFPPGTWETATEKARQRQERERRKPLNRLRHWAHARRHPAVHFTHCTCGRRP